MKTKQMMVMGLAAVCAMALAGEASARGGKGGVGSNGQGMYSGTAAAAGTVTRPAGSQRRDGTFLTTGTTANGGTTRPGNGNGLQDGSHMTVTPVVETAPATVAP